MKTLINSKTSATIIMGANETALWQAETANGPDISDAKARIRAQVEALRERGFTCIEVFAPARAGGWCQDVYGIED